MAKKASKKTTSVRSHARKVPVSKKNPSGVTIVDKHVRRLEGTYLNREDIKKIIIGPELKGLTYPNSKKLKYPNSDKYDSLIALWVDYFNQKFKDEVPLDPNVVKALIGSESSFRENPSENKTAFGLTQITKQTLKILQDHKGEAKDFIFQNITKKDLLDPDISIALTTRWLFRKKQTAKSNLKENQQMKKLF